MTAENNTEPDIQFNNLIPDPFGEILDHMNFNQSRNKSLLFLQKTEVPAITAAYGAKSLNPFDPDFKIDREAGESKYKYVICCDVFTHMSQQNIQSVIKKCLPHVTKSGGIIANVCFANNALQSYNDKDNPTDRVRYTPAVMKGLTSNLKKSFVPTIIKKGPTNWCIIE